MKNPLIPRVNAHLIPGAFYVLLLLAWDSKYRKQTRTRPFRMPGLFGALLCAAGLVAISETAFSQPQKPDPAGIIRLFRSQDVDNPEDSPSWTNPNLDGMRLRPVWSDVQPSQATLDWSSIDEIMELATQHGKFIGLSVTAGVTTPQWVYDNGATTSHSKMARSAPCQSLG